MAAFGVVEPVEGHVLVAADKWIYEGDCCSSGCAVAEQAVYCDDMKALGCVKVLEIAENGQAAFSQHTVCQRYVEADIARTSWTQRRKAPASALMFATLPRGMEPLGFSRTPALAAIRFTWLTHG